MSKLYIEKIINTFKIGEFIIIMDDDDRENEGDLVLAAQHITPEKMSFLIKYTSGIICTPLNSDRALDLGLNLMVSQNSDPKKTNFTVSCDHINVSTGISASDRCLTVKSLSNSKIKSTEFTKPGHIFPLIADPGGVRVRPGHTEAAIEMCKLSGMNQVGVIGELMLDSGNVMRLPDCKKFGEKYGIPIITIKDITTYLNINDKELKIIKPNLVEMASSTNLYLDLHGNPIKVNCQVYKSLFDEYLHTVLIYGDIDNKIVPVRVHSECFTGNVLHSLHCDCYDQFKMALEIIKNIGYGIIIYCGGHEGRGIGLVDKIKAYDLQTTKNMDTIEANLALKKPVDNRCYKTPIEILKYLNVNKIDLITNNPNKYTNFANLVNKRIDVGVKTNKYNKKYCDTKVSKMGHILNI